MRAHAVGRARLAPAADDDVAILAARGHVGQREIGEVEENRLELCFGARKLLLEPRDLGAEVASARDELVRVLPGFLAAGDLEGVGVARRLALLDGLDVDAPLALQRLGPIEHAQRLVAHLAAAQALAQQLGLLAQHPHVVHDRSVSGSARRTARATDSRSWD